MNVTVHIDGGSRGNPGPAAAGVAVHDGAGRPLHEAGYYLGPMTNNAAEYHGLLRALEVVRQLGAEHVKIISDSELMVRQINGQYKVKSPDLRPLYERARQLLGGIRAWEMVHVLRHLNARADELANRAMDAANDVLVTEATETGPAPKAAGVAHAGATARWSVRVLHVGKSDCPLPPEPGADFSFGPGLPAGLCVYAAAAAALAQGTPPPAAAQFSCPRCGTRFEIRIPG
jgi:probable phosphoglycerate mutase